LLVASLIVMTDVDVYGKQDKGLKKEKQDAMNNEIRARVEKVLNMEIA